MAQTNYMIYHLPPSHANAHSIGKCTLLKKYWYKVTYYKTTDEAREDFDRKSAQRACSLALDVNDKKKADEMKKANDKKSNDGLIKA